MPKFNQLVEMLVGGSTNQRCIELVCPQCFRQVLVVPGVTGGLGDKLCHPEWIRIDQSGHMKCLVLTEVVKVQPGDLAATDQQQ
jgi:hypothetical protein